jgi:glycerophosphoryl diester phosphodiesterase
MSIKETKIPTFGEQLIGVDVETEQQDDVTKVKAMFAEIAEMMKKNYQTESKHPLKSLLFDHAVGEILNAQMSVVKVLTLKHYTDETGGTESTN